MVFLSRGTGSLTCITSLVAALVATRFGMTLRLFSQAQVTHWFNNARKRLPVCASAQRRGAETRKIKTWRSVHYLITTWNQSGQSTLTSQALSWIREPLLVNHQLFACTLASCLSCMCLACLLNLIKLQCVWLNQEYDFIGIRDNHFHRNPRWWYLYNRQES